MAGPNAVDRFPRPFGAGSDWRAEGGADDVVRFWMPGDAFPRIILDPSLGAASVLTGDGTGPPTALTGGGAGGAPTDAPYVTIGNSGGLSNETPFSTLIPAADTVANRPASGVLGRLFFGTDTGLLYRDKGGVLGWDSFDISTVFLTAALAASTYATAAALTSDAGTRSSADSTNATAISNEATARAGADTTLQNNITSEATTRGTADTTLQTNITAEATARATAVTGEATARTAADALLVPLSAFTAKGVTLFGTGANAEAAVGPAATNGMTVKSDTSQSTGARFGYPRELNRELLLEDDFVTPGNTNGNIGALGWNLNKSGTSTSLNNDNSSAGHPGYMGFNTGSTAAGRVNINLATTQGYVYATGDVVSFEVIFQLPTAIPNGTDNYQFAAGFLDTAAAATPSGTGFYVLVDANPAVNYLIKWTIAGVGSGTIDTGVAVDLAWHRIGFTFDGTTITAFVDGVAKGTSTTNIPTNGKVFGAPNVILIKTLGVSPVTANLDAVFIRALLGTAR